MVLNNIETYISDVETTLDHDVKRRWYKQRREDVF